MRAAENILGPGDGGCRELAFVEGCEVGGESTWKSIRSTECGWNSIVMQGGKRASFQAHKPFQDQTDIFVPIKTRKPLPLLIFETIKA